MPSTWKIQNDIALLSHSAIRGAVDLDQLGDGIGDLEAFRHQLSEFRLLGLHHCISDPRPIAGPIVDRFVRQNDLYVRFGATSDQPFSPSVYYQLEQFNERSVGIRLIASLQTDLLDTHPDLITRTVCPAGELLKLANENTQKWEPVDSDEQAFDESSLPYCVLNRLPDVPLSYAEMVHPADFRSVSISRFAINGQWKLQFDSLLLDRWMEKGVILRARAQGLFVARDSDERTIFEAYRRFVDAELPLTV